MGFFKVKRTENDPEFGKHSAFLTPKGEYGTNDEASLFGSVKAARDALKDDKWNHTNDYRYDIVDEDDEDE